MSLFAPVFFRPINEPTAKPTAMFEGDTSLGRTPRYDTEIPNWPEFLPDREQVTQSLNRLVLGLTPVLCAGSSATGSVNPEVFMPALAAGGAGAAMLGARWIIHRTRLGIEAPKAKADAKKALEALENLQNLTEQNFPDFIRTYFTPQLLRHKPILARIAERGYNQDTIPSLRYWLNLIGRE